METMFYAQSFKDGNNISTTLYEIKKFNKSYTIKITYFYNKIQQECVDTLITKNIDSYIRDSKKYDSIEEFKLEML